MTKCLGRMNVKLRDYQSEAVDAVLRAWDDAPSALVVLPTGCGKTVVFGEVIRRIQPRRAMVVAHREELIFQARDKIAKITGLDAEIEMGEYRASGWFGTAAPVVVSTIQTQCAGGDGLGRMAKFLPSDYGALVIDEAHHATSASYRRVIDFYRQNAELRVLGVTATPNRADEAALGQVFDNVAYNYEILQAIKDGWLVPIKQQMVEIESLDLSQVRTTAGDLNQGDLSEILEEEENLLGIASSTVEICKDRRALIFAASVKEAERLCEIINRYRPDSAGWICGETDKDERRKILGDFKSGRLHFMVNCGVLTEGFDNAGVQAVVMARPTKSRALYAQMAGRGTRPDEGIASLLGDAKGAELRCGMIADSPKKDLLILDFCGNAGRHKLVSTADILGGEYSDEEIERAVRKAKAAKDAVDMQDALAESRKEIEEEKKKEEERRAQIKARSKYSCTNVDPFSVFDIVPCAERGWHEGKKLSDKQKAILSRIGVDSETIGYAHGKQILDEFFRRVNNGASSYGQTKILKRNGFKCPLPHDMAKRMIDCVAAAQGWGGK